jgi:hypothetical protein
MPIILACLPAKARRMGLSIAAKKKALRRAWQKSLMQEERHLAEVRKNRMNHFFHVQAPGQVTMTRP